MKLEMVLRRSRKALPYFAAMAIVLVPVLFGSCTPGSGITAAESDVIVTLYDNTYNFGAVKTYALIDSVIHVTEDGEDSEDLGRANDALILQLIRDNMDALGYTELVPGVDPVNDPPDVVILVRAQATRFYSVYSGCGYGGYWGGCGYWYPCGGWGCYYPVAGASYAYTTGTLFIDMVQPSEFDPTTGVFASRWQGIVNGVLDDSSNSVRNRVTAGINQAFDQSPYLGTN